MPFHRLTAQLRLQLLFQVAKQFLMGGIDLRFRERSLRIAIGERIGDALAPVGNAFAAVNVEQLGRFQVLRLGSEVLNHVLHLHRQSRKPKCLVLVHGFLGIWRSLVLIEMPLNTLLIVAVVNADFVVIVVDHVLETIQ